MNEQEKIDQEKVEKEYKQLLEKFLFGRLGITEEDYIKYEEFQGDDFENQKECFICNFIYYLTCLSDAKIFLETGSTSLEGTNRFCSLRLAFEEIVLNASLPNLTEEEEKEISGVLSSILKEHLSVSCKLRKKNRKLLVEKR